MREPATEKTRLVVGLGNPGRRYEKTRHNMGFRVVDALAQRWMATGRSAHDGLLFDARVRRDDGPPQRVLMLEPHTFMNRSGQAVASVVRYYRVATEDVLVVLDDIALPLGRIRARPAGSAGGQKGLADVMARLGGQQVPRLRIGIGAPPAMMAAEDYVLSKFSRAEEDDIRQAVRRAAQAVDDWVFEGLQAVMDRYNAQSEPPTGRADADPEGQ